MFGPGLALTYLLVNVYACLRLRSIFPSKTYRRLVTLFYALLSLGFPAAEWLAHSRRQAWGASIRTAGFYALPYLLYLVMAIMAFDLLLGLNRVARLIRKPTLDSPTFRRFRFAFLVLVPLTVVAWGRYNYRHLTVSRYHVALERKSTSLTHLRILAAADFHLNRSTDPDFMPKFVSLANGLAPDIVLMPGDIFEGDTPDEASTELETLFREIRSTYGLFACYGNHESFGRREFAGRAMSDFFEKAHIRMLRDAVVLVADAFYVAGRNDARPGRRKSLDEILAGAPRDLPVLLLDHRPTDMGEVGRSRVDLQVSGHTHDGQLVPVNWITRFQYPLAWGHKRFGHTEVFVTCGIQGWGPPIRTAGRSEVMVIDVDFVK